MSDCSCSRIMVGRWDSGSRNWDPYCPEHGLRSEWWNSDEQTAKRAENNARLRDLQLRAREARKAAGG